MPRTHGEAIDELTKRVDALALALEGLRTASAVEIAHIKDGLKDVQALLREARLVETRLTERVATIEQRCSALEKLSDRSWQGWLALAGAGLALLVALLKK